MPVRLPSPPRIVTPAAYSQSAVLPPAHARPPQGRPAHGLLGSQSAPPAPDPTFLEARERTRRMTEPGWQPQLDSKDFKPFGEDGLTFGDLVDVVNPLQHLPVVGSLYRWLTGDDISPAARVAGGVLFGGPIGLAGSVGGLIVDGVMGAAADQQVLTAMLGPSPFADPAEPAIAVAALPQDGADRMLPVAGTAGPPAAPAMAPMIPLESEGGGAAMIPLADDGGPAAIELDQGQEAALLRFLASQSPDGTETVGGPAPAPVIEIGPAPAAGLDLPGSIPLEMSRALESYRRQQQPDAALAPEIELDIRS